MSVYVRSDSPFYWLRLEGHKDAKGGKLREPTKILVDADTPEQRKRNRALAESAYHARMHELAFGSLKPRSGSRPLPTGTASTSCRSAAAASAKKDCSSTWCGSSAR
jgi:hypothetical protein